MRRGEQEYTVNTTNIGKTQIEPATTETLQVTEPPQTIEINTDDILIAFLSNLDYMSEGQVEAALKAIALKYPEMWKRSLKNLAEKAECQRKRMQ